MHYSFPVVVCWLTLDSDSFLCCVNSHLPMTSRCLLCVSVLLFVCLWPHFPLRKWMDGLVWYLQSTFILSRARSVITLVTPGPVIQCHYRALSPLNCCVKRSPLTLQPTIVRMNCQELWNRAQMSRFFLFFGVILHATVLLWESISVQYMAGNMREVDRPSCISPTHSHTHRCVGMGKGPSVWERWREGSIEQRKSAVNHERRQKPPVFPQCTRLC